MVDNQLILAAGYFVFVYRMFRGKVKRKKAASTGIEEITVLGLTDFAAGRSELPDGILGGKV